MSMTPAVVGAGVTVAAAARSIGVGLTTFTNFVCLNAGFLLEKELVERRNGFGGSLLEDKVLSSLLASAVRASVLLNKGVVGKHGGTKCVVPGEGFCGDALPGLDVTSAHLAGHGKGADFLQHGIGDSVALDEGGESGLVVRELVVLLGIEGSFPHLEFFQGKRAVREQEGGLWAGQGWLGGREGGLLFCPAGDSWLLALVRLASMRNSRKESQGAGEPGVPGERNSERCERSQKDRSCSGFSSAVGIFLQTEGPKTHSREVLCKKSFSQRLTKKVFWEWGCGEVRDALGQRKGLVPRYCTHGKTHS
ncbi:hypothetical protein BDK51DRAFT_28875 [Blyttiomyces helicus]|uniref:Uncharacterized protein n=1 Tax=Blyttiomyces helicus TaxID=388810 RepID=A0A4P9WJT9_9FUNG|nr:hypothetical protein BDK51DRAFT_28875 [Blyttiomyces helicus]|eukprot:RKO93219.1 hypothetical protein BDK51DRAFT_28875 [Blyttiomyces helicus]